MTNGPLHGLRVVELSAIGPVPFAAGMFADLGATVIRVESPRPGFSLPDESDAIHLRGRSHVSLDMRDPAELATIRQLIDRADVLLEGMRPGTLERLGLAPEELLERNPGLVVGRMTGWGQDGPMAQRAGHDMNYISMSGVLAHCARQGQRPVPPVNLIGDFGGGAMFLIAGVLAALFERSNSGKGQVVDAAMVDGSSYLMMLLYSFRAQGMWSQEPGTNLLDTGAPFYDVYETSDGKYLSVGCLEPKFYAEFVAGLGLVGSDVPEQNDVENWPAMRALFSDIIASRTRDHWDEVFAGTDACVHGVLNMFEAAENEHMRARGSFLGADQATGVDTSIGEGPLQPAPAPRFSRTPGVAVPRAAMASGDEALAEWGVFRTPPGSQDRG
ncbi:MAG: CoA transferase [Actinobacteria bacterium]|nr:CoA transferase [Actinomycetota bacterium]